MRFRNYKALLIEMNRLRPVYLKISLWTYSSGRMSYTVAFDKVSKYLDGDLIFKHADYWLYFEDVKGNKVRHHSFKLKIAKVDFVETERIA